MQQDYTAGVYARKCAMEIVVADSGCTTAISGIFLDLVVKSPKIETQQAHGANRVLE